MWQHCLLLVVTLNSMPVALFAWDGAGIIKILPERSHYLRASKCDFPFIPSLHKHEMRVRRDPSTYVDGNDPLGGGLVICVGDRQTDGRTAAGEVLERLAGRWVSSRARSNKPPQHTFILLRLWSSGVQTQFRCTNVTWSLGPEVPVEAPGADLFPSSSELQSSGHCPFVRIR